MLSLLFLFGDGCFGLLLSGVPTGRPATLVRRYSENLLWKDIEQLWEEDDEVDLDTMGHLDQKSLEGAMKEALSVSSTLHKDGVVLVDDVISASLASDLRESILRAASDCEERALSAVLSAGEDDVTRKDLRLSLDDPLVAMGASEVASSAIGDLLVEACGTEDAELWELAAMISYPGSTHQAVHSDTLYDDESPCLFTAFVALQIVEKSMGPTLFLPGTHCSRTAHDDVDGHRRDEFLQQSKPALGLLSCGQASLYDGRLLHAATPNHHDSAVRVLFYLTFLLPGADAEDLGNSDARSILPEVASRHLTLGDLRRTL